MVYNNRHFMKEYSNLIIADKQVLEEKFHLNTKYSYTETLVYKEEGQYLVR